MCKATRKARAMHPEKKLISHFIQPHAPYLSHNPNTASETFSKKIYGVLRNNFGDVALKYIDGEVLAKTAKKVKNIFKKDGIGRNYYEKISNKYGKKYLIKLYKQNLYIALKEIKKISKRLPGKIVVTSDHGELLGENNQYGHPNDENPILLEVPWLEVKS